MPLRCVAYALQKSFREEVEQLQQQDIIASLGVDGTAEWCLDPLRLNQVLIWPVHRRPTLNDFFAKVNNAKYLSLIDASTAYHNLKLDERSSYLTMFACQFDRYWYRRLPFEVGPTGHMFQWRIDEIFKDLPNVFGKADDILAVGYSSDGKDHNDTWQKVIQICRQVNLELVKDRCHFRCTSVQFLVKYHSVMVWDLIQESWKHWWGCPSKDKKGTPSFPWNNQLFKWIFS